MAGDQAAHSHLLELPLQSIKCHARLCCSSLALLFELHVCVATGLSRVRQCCERTRGDPCNCGRMLSGKIESKFDLEFARQPTSGETCRSTRSSTHSRGASDRSPRET